MGKGEFYFPSDGIQAILEIRFYPVEPGSKQELRREFSSGYQMCDHLDEPGGTLGGLASVRARRHRS